MGGVVPYIFLRKKIETSSEYSKKLKASQLNIV